MSSILQVKRFNDCLESTIKLLRAEYPAVPEIKDLERKANLALAANKRLLYDAFKNHIKDLYGAKILASDDTFIEDAKNDHNDQALLPCLVRCWEQPGARTKDVEDLQTTLITRLQQLCDACV